MASPKRNAKNRAASTLCSKLTPLSDIFRPSLDQSQRATKLRQINNLCAGRLFHALFAFHAYAQDMPHLDGLNVTEYEAILDILREDGRVTDKTQFVSVSLYEPDKGDVLSWQSGSPLSRKGLWFCGNCVSDQKHSPLERSRTV